MKSTQISVPLLVVAANACQVGPTFKAPQPITPAAWKHDQTDAPHSWPVSDWWKGFGCSQLNELIAQAEQGNTDLAAATARIREAEAQAEIAGAPLYPAVQVNPTVGPERTLNLIGAERHHVLYQAFVQISYEFDFWGKNRAALESAQATAKSTRFARDVVWMTTSAGIANLYFQNLGLRDRLKVADDNLAHARRILDDVLLQELHGTVPHLAVVQQQVVVADLETVIPPLNQQITAAQVALAILVGKLPEDLHLGSGSLQDVKRPALATGVPSELLARRPDVQQAEANLISANADIRAARAQFLPSFDLNLSAGPMSLGLPTSTVPPVLAYSLLASAAQPIFRGGELRGRVDQTTARYQELLAGNYRKAVIAAFGDVELALASVTEAQALQSAQERSVALARQALDLANQSFKAGFGTILDVLAAETAEYSAQDALVEAQLNYLEAMVGLTKALGGGWRA
jgi:outer membrane protein, multidrug efflux system